MPSPFPGMDPLPTLPVPLLNGEGIDVDLQGVFTETYDKAGFRHWLRYDIGALTPPLTKAQPPGPGAGSPPSSRAPGLRPAAMESAPREPPRCSWRWAARAAARWAAA